MSAVAFQERAIDPPDDVAQDWDELGTDRQREALIDAMERHPQLVEKFYLEALSAGVDPFDYFEDL